MHESTRLYQSKTAYGGELLKTRRGRSRPRPLSKRYSMHLVIRSTRARGYWSFQTRSNKQIVKSTIYKFADKFNVKIIRFANVGNHIHLHIKLNSRDNYKKFIRASTGTITMLVTGSGKGSPLPKQNKSERFWDRRPFTRVVGGKTDFRNVNDYIRINVLEGLGVKRHFARRIVKHARNKIDSWKKKLSMRN